MAVRLLTGALICAGFLYAQNISCTLSGSVADPLQAVVPGAQILVLGELTGFQRLTKSNEQGFFSIPDLIPGVYTLSIRLDGFKTYKQTGIELSSGEKRTLGQIQLEVGALADSVTVTEEAPPVNLGSGAKAGELTGQDLTDMAIRGRDFMDAVGLLAGVVDTSDSREAPGADSIGGIFIAGGRSNSKNFTIDGVTNLDTGSNGQVHSMPSMDSVAELKVLMSNYAAEHGRNSGGAITVITKGGGKKFRGSAGWYNRHENYSANGFFNNLYNVPRQPYRYNIGSYTVSGPIYIPKKFNADQSKLFFFFSQEFQRQTVTYAPRTVRVPSDLERTGDFSRTYDVNGRLIPVYDPLNNQLAFPGNVVPAERQHPVGQAILGLFPKANFVDPMPTRVHQWNYISAVSAPYPRHTEIIRVDYSPKANVQMYVRLANNGDQQVVPYGSWVAGNLNFPLTPIGYRRPGRGATLYNSVTLSPTMFNEFIFGVSQNKLYYEPLDYDTVSREKTGIRLPQWNPDLNPQAIIPNMSFSSVPNYANPSLSDGTPYYNSNTIFSVVENLTKVWQTHTFKFGFYFERTRKDQSANAATRGRVSFDRDRNSPVDTNYAYATALLGNFNTYTEAMARPQGQYRFTNLEWYAQDSWRLTRRLLIEAGLRMYHNMPQYDARDQLATFVPDYFDPSRSVTLLRPALDENGKKIALDPISGARYPEGLVGTYAPGHGDPFNGMAIGGRSGWPRTIYTQPWLSLAPRLGFAWDPIGKGKTAIRGGGGVFYDRLQGNPTMGLLTNPPTISTPSVYYGTFDGLAQVSGKGLLAPSGTVTSMLGHHQMPTTYNYSFGVQHQVGRIYILDVSYVGSLTRHQLWQRNINPIPIGASLVALHPENRDPSAPTRPLPGNFLRPYQGYGNINLYEFASASNYNSLQASFSRRMTKGLQAGAAYTFSKVLGTANTDTTQVSPFFNPRQRNYGPLNFDRTHVLSFRYTWRLPSLNKQWRAHWYGQALSGWELSGITRIQSGEPFTPGFSLVSGRDLTGTASESSRISVLDPAAAPKERFIAPELLSFGNAGNGILRAPGMNNWDLSAYKTFRLPWETSTVQFRFETYNTLNHTQWSNVSRSARFDANNEQVDPIFLEPTANRPARKIQLALRFNW